MRFYQKWYNIEKNAQLICEMNLTDAWIVQVISQIQSLTAHCENNHVL